MALKRVWMATPHYSSRGGAKVKLVVLHTTEGAATIESLGSWYKNPSSQVSSHTGIDDKVNTVGEYVKRPDKAWTQANYNPQSTSTELCAFASWGRPEWLKHPVMLENCRLWILEECNHFGIPRVRLSAAQAQGGASGVCMHADLGAGGGGHWDCGPGFPWDVVMAGAAAPPTASKPAPPPATQTVPPLHVDYFGQAHNKTVADVRTWQQQMKHRGWSITVDQDYGPGSEDVCRRFQAEKHLTVDGLVGPTTWKTSWTAPVT